jgi:tetratricopeptide (TPR) repeat protein
MNRKPVRAALALAITMVLLAAWPGAARATDDRTKAAARELANEAKRDFDAGRFEEAKPKFQRAYAVARVPMLAVWAARASVKCGQWVAASELYRQATQLTPNDLWIGNAQQRAQEDAKKELEDLRPRIPRLRIRVEGATPDEVDVSMDDVHVASALLGFDIPADPGPRHIVGKRGTDITEQTVELREGEHHDAVLKFSPAVIEANAGRLPVGNVALAAPVAAPASTEIATSLTDSSIPPEPADLRAPMYTRWWFWTGVGAAVVAGGVTAYLLTRPSGGACNNAGVPCAEVK